jgi:hypothetical protein
MTVFGMINWTFTWLKPGGKLSYAQFAEMVVVDLLEGGLAPGGTGPAPQRSGPLGLLALAALLAVLPEHFLELVSRLLGQDTSFFWSL